MQKFSHPFLERAMFRLSQNRANKRISRALIAFLQKTSTHWILISIFAPTLLESSNSPDLEHSLTIRVLIQTCQLRREIISIGNPDVIDAWRLLRQRYLDSIETHSEVIDAMRVVKLTAARPPAIYPPDEEELV
jgi:hypothetical protein